MTANSSKFKVKNGILLYVDKDTQELVKKIIRTTELLNHRVSQIEEWINSQQKVTRKLTQGKNDKNI